jgi:hypothetical protein
MVSKRAPSGSGLGRRGRASRAALLCCGFGSTGAGLYSGSNLPGSLFKTTDGGQTWQPLEVPAGESPYTVIALAIDPGSTATIYAAVGEGVAKSTDGGASWSMVYSTPVNPVLALAIDPANPATLYAGTSGTGSPSPPTAAAAGPRRASSSASPSLPWSSIALTQARSMPPATTPATGSATQARTAGSPSGRPPTAAPTGTPWARTRRRRWRRGWRSTPGPPCWSPAPLATASMR